ncbi:RecQ family ATP-dependent DNA helicase [Halomonas marinisediminis]|uniref:ATP-dependent DNA helicase RecQ n=1 Tax=Halomonas marinisediminis TaxID=2546095 RepID=A0ABY2D8B5_9GAMM|nr:RecQ family ATP-dependent DNA helicase [Halomonas marinisediminis]TDB03116.1 ATP-dependent DNA helicase RecQ [Halomonas marinisediminis]
MVQQTLRQVFGYDDFRPGQRPVIEAVLGGRSAAAIFPTGSGKSLCYQLPALHLPHLTLVISPLLALMQDQLAFLNRYGIAAASIDSGQSRDEAAAVMAAVERGEIRILMISVERLKNERFRAFIRRVPISLMVVDEAHCISEWGHNFRPDYLKLPDYQREFAIPQALLLTATATPRVIDDMCERFAIAAGDVTATGFYRENLDLTVAPVPADSRPRALASWLQQQRVQQQRGDGSPFPTIIYVTLQQTAERLAAYLGKAGISATAYHAGLDAEKRQAIQRDFMSGHNDCIVATIAFGMGIDKADIRAVVHFDLPKSIENYSQEIGRAGRDGRPSSCLMLAGHDTLGVLETFVYGDTPEHHGIRRVIDELQGAGPCWELTLNTLSQHANIRPLPLKTLLVQLELRGIIRPRHAYFADYRFKLLCEPENLVARFQGERQAFVQAILDASHKARTWHDLDFTRLEALGRERDLDTTRSRVITALDYFVDKGWLELQSRQLTEVFEVLSPDIDPQALTNELHDDFRDKETTEIARLHAMLELFESERCLSRRLAEWFGDGRTPEHCGHCSACRGQPARLPQGPEREPLSTRQPDALLGELRQRLVDQGDDHPVTPDLLARFLCGITTPLFTRIKARQLPGFGALEGYPYADVRDWVSHRAA